MLQHNNIDPDEALRLVLEAVGPPRSERLPVAEAHGRALAEEIRADRDYPPFPRAMMDGYAVRVAQAGTAVEIVGELPAGRPAIELPGVGQCLEIMTGAPCPPGTEAVVPKEQARREGNRVILPEGIAAGEHIAPQGSDCAAGSVVLQPGQVVTALAVAVLAACGRETVEVTRRPSLAVITTGAELVWPGCEPGPSQIRDCNGPLLAALARQMGIEPLLLCAMDDVEAIYGAIDRGAARDFILLAGGISAGKFDLVPEALREYGAELIFRRVTQRPGKPFLLARKAAQLLFGLPGNPLACHLVFHRYVAAAIRRFEGKSSASAQFAGRLAAPIRNQGDRTHFLLARAERKRGQDYFSAPSAPHLLESTGENSPDPFFGWRVHPLHAASSADVFTPAGANCYLRIPPGTVHMAAGEPIVFEWIGDVAGNV